MRCTRSIRACQDNPLSTSRQKMRPKCTVCSALVFLTISDPLANPLIRLISFPMKHAYRSLLAVFLLWTMSSGLQAQTTTDLPNADLEEWIDTLGYPKPEGWWESHNMWAQDNNITIYGLQKTFITVQNGLFSAKLETVEGNVFDVPTFNKFIPGVLTNGTCFLPNAAQLLGNFPIEDSLITGGQPFEGQLDKWTGFMDYSPEDDDDTAYFRVLLWEAGALVGEGELEVSAATSGFEAFEVQINYSTTMAEPDSMLMYVMSSRYPSAANLGSELYIDNMALEFVEPNGMETLADQMGIAVLAQPNPNTGRFHLMNPIQEPVQLSIYGPNGAVMAVRTLAPGRSQVELGAVAPGLYTYRMQNAARQLVATGKVSVQ